jgi:hypothetical protein
LESWRLVGHLPHPSHQGVALPLGLQFGDAGLQGCVIGFEGADAGADLRRGY